MTNLQQHANQANRSNHLAILASVGACDQASAEPLGAYKALLAVRQCASNAYGLLAAHRTRSSLMQL